MDWKLKFCQFLHLVAVNENYWWDREWASFGISEEEAKIIEAEYEAYAATIPPGKVVP